MCQGHCRIDLLSECNYDEPAMKLLKIIFIILVLVTLGEIGFYFYVLKVNPLKGSNLSEQKNNVILPTSQSIEILKTPTPIGKSPVDLNLVYNIAQSSTPISRDLLKSFTITVELEGEITELTTPTPYPPKDPKEHILRFEFVIKGKEGNSHRLRNSYDFGGQKSIIKVIGRSGENLIIADLKIGDKINIKIDMELTDSKEGTSIYSWTLRLL